MAMATNGIFPRSLSQLQALSTVAQPLGSSLSWCDSRGPVPHQREQPQRGPDDPQPVQSAAASFVLG